MNRLLKRKTLVLKWPLQVNPLFYQKNTCVDIGAETQLLVGKEIGSATPQIDPLLPKKHLRWNGLCKRTSTNITFLYAHTAAASQETASPAQDLMAFFHPRNPPPSPEHIKLSKGLFSDSNPRVGLRNWKKIKRPLKGTEIELFFFNSAAARDKWSQSLIEETKKSYTKLCAHGSLRTILR